MTSESEGAGSSGDMEAHLVACIRESLSLYLYDNAQFLCERLVAAFPTQVSCKWHIVWCSARQLLDGVSQLWIICRQMFTCWLPATFDQIKYTEPTICLLVRPHGGHFVLGLIRVSCPDHNVVEAKAHAGNAQDAQSRYLLAQASLRLGKLTEAEQALKPGGDEGGVSFTSDASGP
jgi:anaphase-promoting complex subunit 3